MTQGNIPISCVVFLEFLDLLGSSVQFSSVQSLSRVRLFTTPWIAARQTSLHHKLPEFIQTMSIESVMPSSHLILCRPLLLLPPIPPSIRVFSNESTLRMSWPKYWLVYLLLWMKPINNFILIQTSVPFLTLHRIKDLLPISV